MPPRAIDRIRDALVRQSQMGKLKLDATFLRRERDTLLQRLGEATLLLLRAGELPEHPSLEQALADLRLLDDKLDDGARKIDEIQQEAAADEAPPAV